MINWLFSLFMISKFNIQEMSLVAINIDCYNFSEGLNPSAKLALNAVNGLSNFISFMQSILTPIWHQTYTQLIDMTRNDTE